MSVSKIKKVFKKILSNGLTVLVRSNHMVPKVSAQIWYGVGSKDEKSGERGLAHLLEHMIFKGTHTLSESDINLITHKLSGSCNAFTSYDYTGYLFDFPTQNWKQSLELFADCMSNCTFKKDLLASEMKAVIQELKMYKDDYSSTMIEELISTLFTDHPYHHPIIGYKQDLWNITSENLMKFYKKHYAPNNATLVVVGDVDPEEVFAEAEKNFGSIPAHPSYAKENYYHNQDLMAKSVIIHRDIAQPIVMLAWVIPGARSKIDYLIDVLSWIIGMGKASRLYKKIIDELHLATELSSFAYDLFDHGVFFITFQPKDLESIDQIIAVINDEFEAIITHGLTKQEILRATKKTESEFISLLESNEKQAYVIGKTYLATGNENYLFEYLDYPHEHLNQELVSFIKSYLRPSIMNKGLVLPLEESEKEYWAQIQDESDTHDARILAQHSRTTDIEPGEHVHTIQAITPKPFNFPKPQKGSLKNGLSYRYFDNSNVPKIDIIIEFKNRSYFDPQDLQGLNNFMSRMLVEGTKKYPGSALADEIAKWGMTLSCTPGFIALSVQTADLEHGLSLLKEVFTQSEFDASRMEKVRRALIADIKNYWDDPSEFSGQIVRDVLYAGHPYSKNLLGDEKTITRITRAELLKAYTQW
ncbi:MAG: insulinase family protein, partial [Candidatus Babeliales bacterium]